MTKNIKSWAGGLLVTLALKGEKAMTKEFVMQVVRDGIKVFGSTILGTGILTGDELTIIASAASVMVSIVWGFIARKDANTKK